MKVGMKKSALKMRKNVAISQSSTTTVSYTGLRIVDTDSEVTVAKIIEKP
jgi:hypothetical protein